MSKPVKEKRIWDLIQGFKERLPRVSQMRDLPPEILEEILGLLPADDLARACLVCRQWHSVIAGRRLFDHLADALCPNFGHYELDSRRRFCVVRGLVVAKKDPGQTNKDLFESEIIDRSLNGIPIWVALMPNLKTLRITFGAYYLTDKRIKDVLKIKSLEELSLVHSDSSPIDAYRSVDDDLADVSSCFLKKLKLEKVILFELPVFVYKITTLEVLSIVNCKMKFIRREIGDLVNLKELTLNNNKLTYLPSTIGRLKKLEGLKIDGCEMLELPPEIGELENLRYLLISADDLRVIPREITNLKKLENVHVEGSSACRACPEVIDFLDYKGYLDIGWR